MSVIEQSDLKQLHALEVIETETETFLQAVYSLVKRPSSTPTHVRLPNGQTMEAIAHPDYPFLPAALPLTTINEARVMKGLPPVDAAPALSQEMPVVNTPSTPAPDTATTPLAATDTVNGGAQGNGKKSGKAAASTDAAPASDSEQNGG